MRQKRGSRKKRASRKKSSVRASLSSALVSGTAAGGAAAASGASRPVVAVTALAGAVSGLVDALWISVNDRRGRRFRQLVDELGAAHAGKDAEEILTDIRERLASDPNLQDVFFEVLRALDEALDNVVIAPLARLVAEYQTKPPDSFFRGLRRVLGDLSGAELGGLEQMLRMLVAREVACKVGERTSLYYGPRDHANPQLGSVLRCSYPLPPDEQQRLNRNEEYLVLSDFPHAPRLLRLLKMHGLADEGQGGMLFGASSRVLKKAG